MFSIILLKKNLLVHVYSYTPFKPVLTRSQRRHHCCMKYKYENEDIAAQGGGAMRTVWRSENNRIVEGVLVD